MKPIIFLFTLVIFYNNINAQKGSSKSPNSKNVIYKTDSIISDNNLTLKFRYSEAKNGLITLVNINIFSKNKLMQVIHTNENVDSYHAEKLIDYNFDGVNDISVNTSCGSGGCLYQVWLYSKKDKKFRYAKELSNRFGLDIDKKHKYVLFHYRGGVDNEIADTLRYINGRLRPIQ
jgi:hypothetical protein